MDYLLGDTNLFIREFYKKKIELKIGKLFWGLKDRFLTVSHEKVDLVMNDAVKVLQLPPYKAPLNPCLSTLLRFWS
jgi:hypothetical protein